MSKSLTHPELIKIIRPIVHGHTKALVNKVHPSWFPRRLRGAIVQSLTKRIVNDICCELTYGRIKNSVGEATSAESGGRRKPLEAGC